MNMTQMQAAIRDLGAQIRAAALQLANAAANADTEVSDLTAQQANLQAMNTRMAALQAAYNAQYQDGASALPPADPQVPDTQDAPGLRAMLRSNEYARAFARAVRMGITPKRGRGDSECKVLYDALTIGGGSPAGEDGGFLVPEDIDQQIRELRRALTPLAELFTQEPVSTNSGWRVMSTNPAAGMASVDEMGEVQAGEQPVFSKVSYTLTKYGLYIPVSNELLADEVAGLFAYLARWIARKEVIQENTLLLAVLDDLTATAITAGEELSGIKGVLNKVLDPMISANASILTNQTGFDVLDNMTDGTGRPLIMREITSGTPKLLNGKTIHVAADATLANVSGKAPVYIGDFQQYATIFKRSPLEIVSTDIGGSAFRTDSTEVRAIVRMGVSKFDTAAVALRTITP